MEELEYRSPDTKLRGLADHKHMEDLAQLRTRISFADKRHLEELAELRKV